MAAPFSSHVPRGPAAVASITPPRAAVATPIARAAHPQSSSTSLQSISSKSSIHPPLQPRSAVTANVRSMSTSVTKTVTSIINPPIPGEILRPSLTGGVTAVQVSSSIPRPNEPLLRPNTVHVSSIPKSVHIMPGYHQLNSQMTDKTGYKSLTSAPIAIPSSTAVISLPSHTIQAPALSSGQTTVSASQASITLTTTSAATLISHASSHHPLGTSHISNPNAVQLVPHLVTAAPMIASPKILSQSVHTMASLGPLLSPQTAIPTSISRNSLGTHATIHSSNTGNQVIPKMNSVPSIPVAKVHPQPLSVSTRSPMEHVETGYNTVNLLISPPHRASPNPVTSSSNMNAVPASVVLMDASQDRNAGSSGAGYTFSTTYYCEPYHQNAITVPQYGDSSFSAAPLSPSPMKQGPIPSQPQNPLTSTPVPPRPASNPTLNPLIMAVDPNPTHSVHAGNYVSSSEVSMAPTDPVTAKSVSTSVYAVNTCTATVYTTTSQPNNSSVSSSSPRPSILRKRTCDGASIVVRKNLLTVPSSTDAISAHLESGSGTMSSSRSSSPSRESAKENGLSQSLDISEPSNLVVPKQEPMDMTESSSNSSTVLASCNPATIIETSPRKKPRKQQLTGNELLEANSTDAEDEFDNKETVKREIVREDENGVRWVTMRQRPPISLLGSYRHSWKSCHNHFLRYTDVKPKEERRPTVNDIANQKGVMQKVNGWKIHHLCTQMDVVIDMENAVHARLTDFLKTCECTDHSGNHDDNKEANKISELVKGNLQRCRIIYDQMKEARQQVLKVTDHKQNVMDVLGKFVSKRAIRKREKM